MVVSSGGSILGCSGFAQNMVSVHSSGLNIGFLNQMAWVASVVEVGFNVHGMFVNTTAYFSGPELLAVRNAFLTMVWMGKIIK